MRVNKLFSEENKVPEHSLKLERWQGPPHINTQYKLCCPLKLFTQSLAEIHVYFHYYLSLLINISSLKLQTAPLTGINTDNLLER